MDTTIAEAPAVPTAIAARLRVPARLRLRSPLARAVVGLAPTDSRLRRKLVRGLFSLVHRRLGVPAPALMTAANGAAIAVDGADSAFLDFAARLDRDGAVEPEVTALLGHLAPKLRVVYDIGANWGYYPLLLGTDPCFAGEVHAFEIAPRTAAGLRRLVAAAGLGDRVMVHAFGLSDSDGEARLSRERHSYLAHIVAADRRGRSDPAPVRRLDGLDLSPPDLLKIDVEGHEAAVLAGARQTLRRHRPLVLLESWYDAARPGAMLRPLQLLAQEGYDLFRPIWRSRPSSPIEGELALVPLAASARPAIAAALNLVAVHPANAAGFFGPAAR
jgi:FkbM family methyltransferase